MESVIFKPGPVTAGMQYINSKGDVYQANRNIAAAKADPKPGYYWTLIATAKEAHLLDIIEKLKQLLISRDEEIALLSELAYPKSKPLAEVTIDLAKDYGVGLGDNTEKLAIFNKEWRGLKHTHLIIHFPSDYGYSSNNRFMFGILSYTCYLNGAVLKTNYTGSDEKLQRSIFAGAIFHTNTETYVGRNDYHYGFKIKTAEAGATEVYLKEPITGGMLKAGDRSLIFGYDHIVGDDPAGTKYNEWITVRSIDGDRITLAEPLEHRYDESWPEFPGVSFGKPRICSTDRLDYTQPCRAEWIGGTMTGSCQILGDKVVLQDMIIPDFFWPSMSKTTIARNCHFKGGVEFDKVGGELLIYDCIFDKHVTNGTGFDFIGMYGCTFKEGYEIASRRYEVKDAKVTAGWKADKYYAPVSEPPAQSSVDKAVFGSHTITRATDNLADKAFDIGRKKSYEVVNVIDGKIVIPYKHTGDDNWSALIRCTEFEAPNETRLFTADGRNGILQNITQGPGDTYIVHCTLPNLKPKDVISWYPLRESVDLGGHIIAKEFTNGLLPGIGKLPDNP